MRGLPRRGIGGELDAEVGDEEGEIPEIGRDPAIGLVGAGAVAAEPRHGRPRREEPGAEEAEPFEPPRRGVAGAEVAEILDQVVQAGAVADLRQRPAEPRVAGPAAEAFEAAIGGAEGLVEPAVS